MSFYINGLEVKICPSYLNYATSYCGKVFRISTGKQMKAYLKKCGYLDVRMSHDGKSSNTKVHVAVADSWLPYEDGKRFVNHIDGDKTNPCVDNLERCTSAENQRHAIDVGLKGKGEKLYNALLTDQDVHELCKRLEEGFTVKDLSEMFETSKDIVRKIRDGSNYPHIRTLYVNIPHKFQYEFSENTIRWVCEQINKGIADSTIAKISSNKNLKTPDVKRIRHKIRYSSISSEYF